MDSALARIQQLKESGWQRVVDGYVEEAIRLTNSDIGYFALMNYNEDQLTMMGWSKSAMEACALINKPIVYELTQTGLWGDCVRQRRPVVTNDYAHSISPTKKGYPQGHVPVIRHMNVPIHDGSKIRGVLGVGNKRLEYSNADAEILQNFADKAWEHVRRALRL